MAGRQRDVDDSGENDRGDDELAPEGKAHHRLHRVSPQIVAVIGVKAHREGDQAAEPRSGREKVHSVVGAMQDAFRAGLHRGVADEAEGREQRPRREGRRPPSRARTEQNDSHKRGRQNEMRRPRMTELGVAQHRPDHAQVEGGAPVAGHRGGFKLKPCDRSQKRDDTGDQREATRRRRQREP